MTSSVINSGKVVAFKAAAAGSEVPDVGELGLSQTQQFAAELRKFDFYHEDLVKGATAALFGRLLQHSTPTEREPIFDLLLEGVQARRDAAQVLLSFAIFEPNIRLVHRAVHDYIVHRTCTVENEFEGVHEIVNLMQMGVMVNQGAALAGLVSVGDRRINAVARAARRHLDLEDIRNYARAQTPRLRNSSVEFCLDWLVELNQSFDEEKLAVVSSAMTLMVFHDEHGVVEDLSEINYVGFRSTKVRQTQTFESYLSEIRPILNYLRNCHGFQPVMESIIRCWEEHVPRAVELREEVNAVAR